MKRRRVEFAEVELRPEPRAGNYRLRIGDRVELEVPGGFDPEDLFALLLLVKEVEL
jgi:hypothetical protein